MTTVTTPSSCGPRSCTMRPHLAAIAFLARYSGRKLDAYRHGFHALFEWSLQQVGPCSKRHGPIWKCTGHPWRNVDSRPPQSTGGYQPRAASTASLTSGRFPAQYARRPKVNPCERRGLHHGELGWFLFTAECFDRPCSSAGAVGVERPRASEACESNIEEMAIERGHRVLRVVGKGHQPALIPLVPRTVRTIDLAVGERTQGPVLVRHNGQRLDRCTAVRWANQPSGGAGWSQAGRGVASIVAAN